MSWFSVPLEHSYPFLSSVLPMHTILYLHVVAFLIPRCTRVGVHVLMHIIKGVLHCLLDAYEAAPILKFILEISLLKIIKKERYIKILRPAELVLSDL